MKQRLLAGAVLALILVACSSGGTVPTVVPTVPGGLPSATAGLPTVPAAGTPGTNPQPNTGNFEAMARALTPPGATELQFVQSGGLTALYLSSTSSLEQLEAFFDQAIPAQGISVAGKTAAMGSLIYSLENPVGGVVVTSADQAGHAITISLGQTQ